MRGFGGGRPDWAALFLGSERVSRDPSVFDSAPVVCPGSAVRGVAAAWVCRAGVPSALCGVVRGGGRAAAVLSFVSLFPAGGAPGVAPI